MAIAGKISESQSNRGMICSQYLLVNRQSSFEKWFPFAVTPLIRHHGSETGKRCCYVFVFWPKNLREYLEGPLVQWLGISETALPAIIVT